MNHVVLWFDAEQKFCRQFNRKTMLLEETYDFRTEEAQIRIVKSQNQLRDCAFIYENDPEAEKKSCLMLCFDARGKFTKKLIMDKAAVEVIKNLESKTSDILLHNNGEFTIIKLQQDLKLKKNKE